MVDPKAKKEEKKEVKKDEPAAETPKTTEPEKKNDGEFFDNVFSRGKKDEPKPTSDPFAEDKAAQQQAPEPASTKPSTNAPKPGIAMTK